MSLTTPHEEERSRKSSRARKQIERFEPNAGQVLRNKGKKRQREEDEDGIEEDSPDESSDDEPDVQPLKGKKRLTNGVKKTKTNGAAGKSKKKMAPVAEVDSTADGDGLKTDCPLFTAMLSTEIALQPLIEEWVETYQGAAGDEVSEKAAVHEIILFFIRCCGLTADITEDEAMDEDGVLDVLERIQDQSVKTTTAVYPLTSKAKPFRSFKANVNTFISHLVSTLSLSPLLYHTTDTITHSTPIVPLLLVWLHSMSSSPLRPIRHTSTYLTLKINSALCEVAAIVTNDLGTKQRQRETEQKKGGSGAAYNKRLKDAEQRVEEEHKRKTRLEEYMLEIVDVMFIHRIRDADPAIRADCMKELGVWMKKYPGYYVTIAFLSNFSRGCNDPDSHARLETVKALSSLYTKDTFVTGAQGVTLRLAPRLVEMALRDTDLTVRVHAITTITLIDKTGILKDDSEEERTKVAKLVYDSEPRIRKAVGGFVDGLWEERKEELEGKIDSLRGPRKKRAAEVGQEAMGDRVAWKALASLLVEIANSLEDDVERGGGGDSLTQVFLPVVANGTPGQEMSRAAAAVEALWSDVEILKDWEGLVNYLLLDHSTSDQDPWLLADEEEDFFIQILVVCLKKEEKDDDLDERTKTLIKTLPRLFSKHQADVGRMVGILEIPQNMNLGLYLDLRMSSAYEDLWSDITKQFLQHSSPILLKTAITTITHLLSNSAMTTSNSTKFSELEESLLGSLRESVDGQDVVTMSLDDDQYSVIEAIMLRLCLLCRSKDLTESLEDEEGGQSSGWEIVCAFAERGRLGFKEEAKIVEYAVQVVFLHLTWLFKRFDGSEGDVTRLEDRQKRALGIFQSNGLEASNALENVKRQAFISFINLHILFHARPEPIHPATKACSLELPSNDQYKLSGAFQAAVERYATERESRNQQDSEDETPSVEKINQDLLFLQLTSVFIAAVRCGVLEVDHAKVPLAHYGRFGPTYDAVVKKLVDVLKDEGIYNGESQIVQHVVKDALQESFTMYLDTDEKEPTTTISLSKLVASAFQIHGNHFSILKQISPSEVHDLHESSITWLCTKILGPLVKQEKASKTKDLKLRIQSRRLRALTYFKVLISLLAPITGGQALKIKRHLEERIQETEASPTGSENWNAYRLYERRLVGIASRDGGVVGAAKGVRRKGAETDGEEGEGDEDGTPVPRPKVNGRGRKKVVSAAVVEGEEDEDDLPASQADVEGNSVLSKRGRNEDEEEAEGEGQTQEEPMEVDDTAAGLVMDNVEPDVSLDLDLDMDLEVDQLPKEMRGERERSESLQPVVGKKRNVRRL